MVQPINESTHQELLALTPSGDLMDLARRLRRQGVESLLICRPDGRIAQVVTDRQIAQLASPDSRAMTQFATPGASQAGAITPDEPITVPQSRRSRDELVRQDQAPDDLGQVTRR
jgi:hypothetical protein